MSDDDEDFDNLDDAESGSDGGGFDASDDDDPEMAEMKRDAAKKGETLTGDDDDDEDEDADDEDEEPAADDDDDDDDDGGGGDDDEQDEDGEKEDEGQMEVCVDDEKWDKKMWLQIGSQYFVIPPESEANDQEAHWFRIMKNGLVEVDSQEEFDDLLQSKKWNTTWQKMYDTLVPANIVVYKGRIVSGSKGIIQRWGIRVKIKGTDTMDDQIIRHIPKKVALQVQKRLSEPQYENSILQSNIPPNDGNEKNLIGNANALTGNTGKNATKPVTSDRRVGRKGGKAAAAGSSSAAAPAAASAADVAATADSATEKAKSAKTTAKAATAKAKKAKEVAEDAVSKKEEKAKPEKTKEDKSDKSDKPDKGKGKAKEDKGSSSGSKPMTQSHLGVFNGGLATAAAKKKRTADDVAAESAQAAEAAPAPAPEEAQKPKKQRASKVPAAAPAAAPAANDAAKSKMLMTQFIAANIGDAMQDVLDHLRMVRGPAFKITIESVTI
jgi:hypothetical protein